jgi:prepilin-type N-terminal cleavage/methylation domain-containing protein
VGNKKRCGAGFTLLEILVVLLLFALLVGMAVPRLMTNELDLARREAHRFRNVVQWLADQSAYTGDTYRLHLNLEKQAYRCLVLIDKEFVEVLDPLVRSRKMPDHEVVMRWMPYEEGVLADIPELEIDFTPFGPVCPVLVGFASPADQQSGYSVSFSPGQPRPVVSEGIHDWSSLSSMTPGNEAL